MNTDGFIIVEAFQLFNRLDGIDEGYTSTGDDTFLNGSSGSTQCVIYTCFLFFHFNFRGSTYIKYSYTTCQLCKSFLKFLLVIIRGGGFDLRLDLVDPGRDRFLCSSSVDNRCVVLVYCDFFSAAEMFKFNIFQFVTLLFADHGSTSENSDVFQHSFTTISKSWCFDSNDLQLSTKAIDN